MTWKVDPFWEMLANRCEENEYRDRELDSDIDVALHGGEIEWRMANYTMDSYPCRKYASVNHHSGFGFAPVPEYTMSIDAAYSTIPQYDLEDIWKLVFFNRGYTDGVYLGGKAKARVDSPLSSGGWPYFEGVSIIPARAICAATMRAHGHWKTKVST